MYCRFLSEPPIWHRNLQSWSIKFARCQDVSRFVSRILRWYKSPSISLPSKTDRGHLGSVPGQQPASPSCPIMKSGCSSSVPSAAGLSRHLSIIDCTFGSSPIQFSAQASSNRALYNPACSPPAAHIGGPHKRPNTHKHSSLFDLGLKQQTPHTQDIINLWHEPESRATPQNTEHAKPPEPIRMHT